MGVPFKVGIAINSCYMALNKKIISDKSGGVLIIIALMIPVLLGVTGLSVDLGRLYAAQAKAQNASDNALLGAVATSGGGSATAEARRLFNANFPTGYLGTTATPISVSQSGNVYNSVVNITVPTNVMQLFGAGATTLTIRSQVTRNAGNKTYEVAMVMDNTATMNLPALRSGATTFVNSMFGASTTLANVYVSIIPYNVSVNVGRTHFSWAQSLFTFLVYSGGGGNGFFANRNPDIPPNPAYNDVTDVAPTGSIFNHFRTPYGLSPGTFHNGDYVTRNLARMLFDSNRRTNLITGINAMRNAVGSTRVNVGLMWGWFSLSPNWTGRWSAGLPGLPYPNAANRIKTVILVAGSKNNVYLGGTQTCGAGVCPVSNDNTTTDSLCTAMKGQGIVIYTIGYGAPSAYDANRLENCSSGTGYFFTAVDAAELDTAFQAIADSLNYSNLQLSQ